MRNSRPLTIGLTLLALVMIVACGSKAPAPRTDFGYPFYDNMESAKLAAHAGNKAILVDFYTDW
jgi:hypothetical protein